MTSSRCRRVGAAPRAHGPARLTTIAAVRHRPTAPPRAPLNSPSLLLLLIILATTTLPPTASARPPPPQPPSADARALEPLRDLVQRSGRAASLLGWRAGTDPCPKSGDCLALQPNPRNLPPCPWTGVSCRSGRVIAIDLSCDASQPAPPAVPGAPLCVYTPLQASPLDSPGLATLLPRLTELRALSLRGTGLQGVLPPEWGSPGAFPKLQVLDLADNALSGPVPPEWWASGWNPNDGGGGSAQQGGFGGGSYGGTDRQRFGAASGGGVVFFFPLGPPPPPPPPQPTRTRGLARLRMLDLSGNCALCGEDPFPAGPALVNTRGTAIPLDCARVSLPQGVGGVGAGLGSGCSPGMGGHGGSGGSGSGASYRVLMNILAAAGVIAVAIALGVCQQRLCPWLCCGSGNGGADAAYVDARWLCCWRLQRVLSFGWLVPGRESGGQGGARDRPQQQQQQRQQGRAPAPVKFFEAVVELGAPPPHAGMSSGGDGGKGGPAAAAAEEAGPSGSASLEVEEVTAPPAPRPRPEEGDEEAGTATAVAAVAASQTSAPPPPPPPQNWRARLPPWLARPGAAAAASSPQQQQQQRPTPRRTRRSRRTRRDTSLAAPPPAAADPREPPAPTVVVLPDQGIALMRRCDDDGEQDDQQQGRRHA